MAPESDSPDGGNSQPYIGNPDAEAALLGAFLLDNALIDPAADKLDPADFCNPIHQRIYETILAETAKGRSVTAATLKPYFDNDPGMREVGGIAYLARLMMDGQGMLAPRDLTSQIRELANRRRIYAGLHTASEACADLNVTVGEIMDHADAALAGRGKDVVHQPTAFDCFDELLDGLKNRVPGVTSTTIPSLDNVLGPMRPKQLIIGAGRPGMGKTAAALSYALGATMSGHGVLFVSLEMSSTELGARMAADVCFDGERGVPFSAITKGDLTRGQMEQIARAQSMVRGLPFQIIDAGSLTVGRLAMLVRRHARRMAANGHKLELVIIDYLQLLSPDSRSRSNYEAVSEVSRSLKALAKDNGLAVFALAQLSRDVEKRTDKRPQLSDLRDSGQIEQDADAVLFLLRLEYYLRQAEPPEGDAERPKWEKAMQSAQGQIEFIVAKRRNGTTGSAFGKFHGGYQAVRG